ncbi:MAG TPA: hypothetical protein VIG33_12830, partial [Pseudobdellovibrionaceae bacterium]
MKNLVWIFLALLLVSVANAGSDGGVYGYAYWAPKIIHEYLQKVDTYSPVEGPVKCEHFYSRGLEKGV